MSKEVINIIDKNKKAMIIPDGIAVIGKDCKVIVFNEAASRITGYSEEDIVSKDCEILFSKNMSELKYITESIVENKVFTNHPINLTCKNRNVINVLASMTPINKSGEVISIVLVFRNTKEMLSLSEELESRTLELVNQRNKLEAIFNSNIEGTFTIDHEWRITSFNNSASNITGYTREEAIGNKCWDIFNSALCGKGCHMEETIHKGRSTIGNELEIIHKNGNRIPIHVNTAVLLNNKNEKTGAVETFLDNSEIKYLSDHLSERFSYENIIGKNKEIKQIISVLDSIAQTDSSVFITGDSGTGKELAARAIHLNSARRRGPFVAVNCSAFVESLVESELFGHEKGAFTGAVKTKIGRFELAQGGTLFLDEIGDLSLAVQTKLLRVLETHEFERVGSNKIINMDARIIAATNKNLSEEILEGRFREDLFYRINIINIHLPPLRERKDDLPLLVNHFINYFNEKLGRKIIRFSSQAYELLLEYDWPGNIRELENAIEHCFVLCGSNIIQAEHLPKRLKEEKVDNTRESIAQSKNNFIEIEKEMIISALNNNRGNRTRAAKELKVNPSTLWRKMKKLKIEY